MVFKKKLTIAAVLLLTCVNCTLEANTGLSSLIRNKRQQNKNCDGFWCKKSKQCIDYDKECDGKEDCVDGSDESNACHRIRCPNVSFKCRYGACINKKGVCNGKTDCKDNSDEDPSLCRTIAPTTPNSTSSGTCKKFEFLCKNGECIDDFYKCDGKQQCSDGTDETAEICLKQRCPGFSFKCAYGGCISDRLKCNGIQDCIDGSDEMPSICGEKPVTPKITTTTTTRIPIETPTTFKTTTSTGGPVEGSCVLPQHPTNGKWSVIPNTSSFKPGDFVSPTSTIEISCKQNYKLMVGRDPGVKYILCLGGTWTSQIGNCERLCPALVPSASTEITCLLGNKIWNCSEPVPDTEAKFKCTQFYEDLSLSRNPTRVCSDGTWSDSLPRCLPACGKKNVASTPLISGGQKAKKGEYPWQVALYRKDSDGSKKHICGGSLISRKVIITAAHCVTNEDGPTLTILPKEDYSVGVGKYYRPYNDSRDTSAKYSELENIFVPKSYGGSNLLFSSDIAILITTFSFELNAAILPVCVDWSNEGDNHLQDSGSTGIVTGWGYTESGKNPSEELKVLGVPYIPQDQCKKDLPADYISFVTFDKLCSGHRNKGQSVCEGDSGGGLLFQGPNDNRFYLRGIVSISPKDPSTGSCDTNEYALYTAVNSYINFIKEKSQAYLYS